MSYLMTWLLGLLMGACLIVVLVKVSNSFEELWQAMTRGKLEHPFDEGFSSGYDAGISEAGAWATKYIVDEFDKHLADIQRMFAMKLEMRPLSVMVSPLPEDTARVMILEPLKWVTVTRPTIGLTLYLKPKSREPIIVPERYVIETTEKHR